MTKIDYNTANIIIPISCNGEEVQIYVPPISEQEIKDNALLLGEFFNYLNELNLFVLLQDYEVYIGEAIDTIIKRKFNSLEDPYAKKFKADLNTKIQALLERILLGAYYVEKMELKTADTLPEGAKTILKGSLLFFIVMSRYVKPTMAETDWVEKVNEMNILYTSLSATEWLNTLKTPSTDEETLGL